VTVHRQLDALISQIYFGNETLHVSDSSSVHHQQLFTVHTAMAYVIQVCRQLSSRIRIHPDPDRKLSTILRDIYQDSARKLSTDLYDIYHGCVYSE
jgi:hypothetical protein